MRLITKAMLYCDTWWHGSPRSSCVEQGTWQAVYKRKNNVFHFLAGKTTNKAVYCLVETDPRSNSPLWNSAKLTTHHVSELQTKKENRHGHIPVKRHQTTCETSAAHDIVEICTPTPRFASCYIRYWSLWSRCDGVECFLSSMTGVEGVTWYCVYNHNMLQ